MAGRKLAGLVTLLLVGLMPLVALGDHGEPTPQGNCPVEGKVESVVDGDLNDIVLEAGTHVCIKGGQTTVFVTADGEATLVELLGTEQDVSHYTIIELPTTTTTVVEETTTTVVEETTTTEVEETTTTEAATTTSEDGELPFTGPEDYIPHIAVSLGMLALGGMLLRASRVKPV